jgi:serine O-acetyltransferase
MGSRLRNINLIVLRLLKMQRRGGFAGRVATLALQWHGTDVHPNVQFPDEPWLRHGGIGVVIHSRTRIGSGARVYQGVSIVRGRIWEPIGEEFAGFVIEDRAVLGAGCTIIHDGPEPLVVGEGSVVGAGAVLMSSTGPYEIWVGNPARRVGMREPQRR